MKSLAEILESIFLPSTLILNEFWHVRASVMTVTFELAIDGFGDKRLGGVNMQ
jgi:hypothetical protein